MGLLSTFPNMAAIPAVQTFWNSWLLEGSTEMTILSNFLTSTTSASTSPCASHRAGGEPGGFGGLPGTPRPISSSDDESELGGVPPPEPSFEDELLDREMLDSSLDFSRFLDLDLPLAPFECGFLSRASKMARCCLRSSAISGLG